MHAPQWCLTTTPHSGTRYVRDAFINAGCAAFHARTTKSHIDGKTDLIWGHCDVGHENWMDTVAQTWPLIRHVLVVRDPIHNLCTHMADIEVSTDNRPWDIRHIQNNLDLYRRIQDTFVERFNPYIHKVEDPIEQLGKGVGIELVDHGKRHTRFNRLRQAVDDRDMPRIAEIIQYGTLWEWFITEHSANLAPLYRDQLGYDFWWQNG